MLEPCHTIGRALRLVYIARVTIANIQIAMHMQATRPSPGEPNDAGTELSPIIVRNAPVEATSAVAPATFATQLRCGDPLAVRAAEAPGRLGRDRYAMYRNRRSLVYQPRRRRAASSRPNAPPAASATEDGSGTTTAYSCNC